MPKIIENVREKLMTEARRQVMELGYSAMTIRSVAGACGVGVGTVYNYFSSKDMLVASFMVTDWQRCMAQMTECSARNAKPEEVLRCIYDVLKGFAEQYAGLFRDEGAAASFATVLPERHKQLRSQFAQPLQSLCSKQNKADPEFLAEFIAEAMLTWTLEGRSFEEISSILLQLF